MKIREGRKYDIEIKLYTQAEDEPPKKYMGAYFMGIYLIDEENPTFCDCCGKHVMKKFYVFRTPLDGASFDEAAFTYYDEELIVGQTCLSKAKITPSLL